MGAEMTQTLYAHMNKRKNNKKKKQNKKLEDGNLTCSIFPAQSP
jgi:hypothetical protein